MGLRVRAERAERNACGSPCRCNPAIHRFPLDALTHSTRFLTFDRNPRSEHTLKAPPFAYVKPSSLPEVFELLERHGGDAKILAGGQSLIPALNMRLSAPAVLIDVNGIRELCGITVEGGWLRIGALTRHDELAQSTEIARHAPLISQAMPHVAHAAIRTRGTFGGSIAFADPSAELPACA